jgi:hypothetical protein
MLGFFGFRLYVGSDWYVCLLSSKGTDLLGRGRREGRRSGWRWSLVL